MTAYDLMNESPVLTFSIFLIAAALVLSLVKFMAGHVTLMKSINQSLPVDHVWAYERCFCRHETGFEVVSLHATKELAEAFMDSESNSDLYSDGMRVRRWRVLHEGEDQQ